MNWVRPDDLLHRERGRQDAAPPIWFGDGILVSGKMSVNMSGKLSVKNLGLRQSLPPKTREKTSVKRGVKILHYPENTQKGEMTTQKTRVKTPVETPVKTPVEISAKGDHWRALE